MILAPSAPGKYHQGPKRKSHLPSFQFLEIILETVQASSALCPVQAACAAPVLAVGSGTAWEEFVWLKAAAELSPKDKVDTA